MNETTCRVCGEKIRSDPYEDGVQLIGWVDEGGDVLCPAKDWDDGAGPYHEPKDTL